MRQWLRMTMIDKITLLSNSKIPDRNLEFFGCEQLGKLFARPAVEFAFVALAIGILGGIETAFRMSHVTAHIIKNIPRDVRVLRVPAEDIRIEVQLGQLRVIVEHFFEMGYQPLRIDRVTGKTAAQFIVNAPCCHALVSMENHLGRLLVMETPGVA